MKAHISLCILLDWSGLSLSTSISFFKKLAGSLAWAIACMLVPHKMAYVSRFIEWTWMTPVIFPFLGCFELSNLPLTYTQVIGTSDCVDNTSIFWVFQHFDYYRSLDSVTNLAGCFYMLSSSSWLHLWVPNLTALLHDWMHQSLISCSFNVLMNSRTCIQTHKSKNKNIAEASKAQLFKANDVVS